MNLKLQIGLGVLIVSVIGGYFIISKEKAGVRYEELTEEQKHLPEYAVLGMSAHHGLEVRLMASEPLLTNPTNIDVDDKGRVWVTEAYNYRFNINKNPSRPAGDRILILEDNNGDGILDTANVFYQGPELIAPLGLCVLGNRVIVSQSPYVWDFYDDDGDGRADRKEILFQGIEGVEHDHGVHSFVFGPDGKLYFNFGNYGKTLLDKAGNVVLDQDGDEIGPAKYKEGMLFRCDTDGSNVECLGYNFRNPYEAAVDSYGNVWQSDNDDDGNRGVRINFILEYGNFGYTDEMTGASWGAPRINREDSIPARHWHQNDPGVVPNLLNTGSGSPTGILFYEGSLLPPIFQHQLIHAEPGHNVIRSYPREKSGAGYTATMVDLLNGSKNQWFRPTDISVAPDGSLIVSDWYDPGVGGHQIGDLQRGRLFRIAPSRQINAYKAPANDFSTAEGAIKALESPNNATRYKAFTKLVSLGDEAIPHLDNVWGADGNPTLRARVLWILAKSSKAEDYLARAIKDSNPDLRITALRAARQSGTNDLVYISALAEDQDIQVRRECAISLRGNQTPEAAELWAKLALQHDGSDKWYLESLGIGAYGQWDRFMTAYLNQAPDPLALAGGRDVIWRSRSSASIKTLSELATDSTVPIDQRLRYFRAFDFHQGVPKTNTLFEMLERSYGNSKETAFLVLSLLDPEDRKKRPEMTDKAIDLVLEHYAGRQEYLDVLAKFRITDRKDELLQMVVNSQGSTLATNSARLLLEFGGNQQLADALSNGDVAKGRAILSSLGSIGSQASLEIFSNLVFSEKSPLSLRKIAIALMGKSASGERAVLTLLKSKNLPDSLVASAVDGLAHARDPSIYAEAKAFLPASSSTAKPESQDRSFEQLMALSGNAQRGKALFSQSCSACHVLAEFGTDFGPNLSDIGSKLPKQGIYEALVNPSAGISFGYETWQVKTKDGSTTVGIVVSRTEDNLMMKYPGGTVQDVKLEDITDLNKLPHSLMPNYHDVYSDQEFADLLEFLSKTKK